MNAQQPPAPVRPEHRNTPPAVPLWNTGTDNPDPYQDPSRVIPFLMGV